jgi:hypothetical protein
MYGAEDSAAEGPEAQSHYRERREGRDQRRDPPPSPPPPLTRQYQIALFFFLSATAYCSWKPPPFSGVSQLVWRQQGSLWPEVAGPRFLIHTSCLAPVQGPSLPSEPPPLRHSLQMSSSIASATAECPRIGSSQQASTVTHSGDWIKDLDWIKVLASPESFLMSSQCLPCVPAYVHFLLLQGHQSGCIRAGRKNQPFPYLDHSLKI